MKKLFVGFIAAMCLSGCGAGLAVNSVASVAAPVVEAIVTQGDTVLVKGKQSLIVAEYAYNGAAAVVLPMLESRAIHGENATRVRAVNQFINEWLEKGYAASTDAERALAAAKVMQGVTQLEAIKGDSR